MVGCRKGFAIHVEKVNPSDQVIHCMFHRENLASLEFSATLHGFMKDELKIIASLKSCVHHVELRTNSYYFITMAGGCHAAKFYLVI